MTEEKQVNNKNNLEVEEWTRYLTFLTIFLSVFTFFFLFSIVYRVFTINEVAEDLLSINVKDLPFLGGIIGFASLLIIFSQRIADIPKIGRKKALLIYGIITLSFSVISYYTPNVVLYIIIRFIASIFALNISNIIISEEVPARFRGRTWGIVLGVGMTSSLVTALLSIYFNFIVNGWQFFYLVIMIPGIITIIILSLGMKETRRFASFSKEENQTSLTSVLNRKNFKFLFISSILYFFLWLVYFTIKTYFKPYLLELGFNYIDIGFIAFFSYIGSIIGYLSSGFLSDHIGRRPTILITVGIYIIGSIFFLFFTDFIMIFIGFIIVNTTFSVFWATAVVYMAEFFQTKERSTATGWISFFASFAIIFGNFSITPLSYAIGWGPLFFYLGSIALIGIIITVLLLPETKGRILEEIIDTEIGSIMK